MFVYDSYPVMKCQVDGRKNSSTMHQLTEFSSGTMKLSIQKNELFDNIPRVRQQVIRDQAKAHRKLPENEQRDGQEPGL